MGSDVWISRLMTTKGKENDIQHSGPLQIIITIVGKNIIMNWCKLKKLNY